MAIASGGTRGTLDTGSVRNAIQWDLRNPLAGWHELHSTHPPVARRIDHLGDLVASLGQAPLVVFDRQQPESYWDEFLVDLFCWRLPMPGIVFTVCAGIAFTGGAASEGGLVSAVPLAESWAVLSGGLIAWGVGRLLQHRFRYLCGSFPNLPGIMFLDDRQPMAIWEMLFGFMRAAGIPRGGVGKGAVPPAAAAAVARDGPRDLPGGFAPRRPGTTSCSSARHPACWWRSWRS